MRLAVLRIRITGDAHADQDTVCNFDADPDPTFHFDADPDPVITFHFDADLDPSFQIKAQNLEKVLI